MTTSRRASAYTMALVLFDSTSAVEEQYLQRTEWADLIYTYVNATHCGAGDI